MHSLISLRAPPQRSLCMRSQRRVHDLRIGPSLAASGGGLAHDIMISTRAVQIDAFTSKPCRGNSAAVCLVPHAMREALPADTMQAMAAENNLSETAFISPTQPDASFEDSSDFHLRWFTPAIEVPLCGHATLAAAFALLHGAPRSVLHI